MTDFKTSAEMFDAGYAIRVYSINSDVSNWRFRDEYFKTFTIESISNTEPNIQLARIEDVRARAI